ncbi:MAG: type II toxin-antitoxin system VapC family toxin [Pseudolysinimonas sp.]|uniref:PIN domain-containing protein n=1 Tax=Pseudolysinimonas sp. TaxID=2680009 RepID=UPI0032667115
MIGVDSNVLLRHLLDDDATQSRQAAAFFSARSAKDPAFLSVVVLVETVWTLSRRDKVPMSRVVAIVSAFLSAEEIVVQAPDVVRRALRDAAEHGTDLADAIIAHLAIDADCEYTVTFDRRASELPGMALLE